MPNFFDGLDRDIRTELIAQLRNLWTHTSTALEGNTLTLGETAFVIDQGLTVSGKSLKDHHEVIGHARAIEIIYSLIRRDTPITEQDLFTRHTARHFSLGRVMGGEPLRSTGRFDNKRTIRPLREKRTARLKSGIG